MKRPPDCRCPASPAGTAPARQARTGQPRSALRVLGDPRVRLGLGAVVMLLTAAAAQGNHVGRGEARAFRVINGLPDSIYRPAWVIMQMGALGAAPAAAGVALLAHDGELARRMLAGGGSTWALSKLVKRLVRRPRPATLVTGARCRGRDAAGLGYLSGHAGVAAALGAAALPRLGPAGRAVAVTIVPMVGLSRVYVGAHLPLDIAGGAALGIAVEAAVALLQQTGQVYAPATAGRSQRRCSQSPCSCSRRHSTAVGEIWVACMRAALRCLARSTRMHRSTSLGDRPANG